MPNHLRTGVDHTLDPLFLNTLEAANFANKLLLVLNKYYSPQPLEVS